MADNDTFVKITNKTIYEEIQSLKRLQQEQHEDVIELQGKMDGRIRASTKIGLAALGLAIMVLGFLFEHVRQ